MNMYMYMMYMYMYMYMYMMYMYMYKGFQYQCSFEEGLTVIADAIINQVEKYFSQLPRSNGWSVSNSNHYYVESD